MKKEKKKIRYTPSGVMKKFVLVFVALYMGIMGRQRILCRRNLCRITRRRFRA